MTQQEREDHIEGILKNFYEVFGKDKTAEKSDATHCSYYFHNLDMINWWRVILNEEVKKADDLTS
jgi:hypothetical protein